MGDWEDIFGEGADVDSLVDWLNKSHRREREEEDDGPDFGSYQEALNWARCNPGRAIVLHPRSGLYMIKPPSKSPRPSDSKESKSTAGSMGSLAGSVHIGNIRDWQRLLESGCTAINGDLTIDAPGLTHLPGDAPIVTARVSANTGQEIRLLNPEDAETYLAIAPELRSTGNKLILRVAEEVLETHRDRLRTALPSAVLRPIPPPRQYSPDQPVAGDRPPRVPKNFRDLPPCEKHPEEDPPGGGFTTTYLGSGVPASQHPLAKHWFSRCMNCASTDTRVIYASSSIHFGRVERWTWDECVYECKECGSFNNYRVSDVH